jgi:hypothetical protein
MTDTIATSRVQRQLLKKQNRQWPVDLREVPRAEWPPGMHYPYLIRVWRSRGFVVQLYEEPGEPLRLSINRSELGPAGRWKDGITWDEIQNLKGEAGFGSWWAVEVYPADGHVVNVANVRHIWLLDAPPAFAWRRP